MSVMAHDAVGGPVVTAVVPVRPSRLLSLLLDGLLGASAYIISYWLRFDSERLAAFLPGAWSAVPLVVGAQPHRSYPLASFSAFDPGRRRQRSLAIGRSG